MSSDRQIHDIASSTGSVSDANTAAKREIRPLTGVRGIAALWVVLLHAFIFIPRLDVLVDYPQYNGIKLGYLAVDLFFILSGFVLAMTQRGGTFPITIAAFVDFFAARAFRLFPLHWAVLAVFAIIILATSRQMAGSEPYTLKGFLTTALLVQNWFESGNNAWNTPSWSISAEIVAYCLFPLIFVVSTKVQNAKFAGAMVVLLVALLAGVMMATNSTTLDHIRKLGIVRCVFEFSAGVFLWRTTTLMGRDRLPGTALLLVGAAIIALTVAFPGVQLVAPIGFGLVIVACYSHSALAARLFGNRIMFFLGKISFSIYLVHFLLLVIFNYFAARWALRDQEIVLRYAWIALQLPVIIGISTLTWRWIERPGQRLSHRIRQHLTRPARSPVELRA